MLALLLQVEEIEVTEKVKISTITEQFPNKLAQGTGERLHNKEAGGV